MEYCDFYYPSSNGKCTIRARKLIPDGKVKGVVQIVHGIAEYIDRYDSFMTFFAENGFAVCGNDHLGHGKSQKSEAEKGYFAPAGGWKFVVDDMLTLHDMMKSDYPDVPYVMFGHSMGSFLTRTYMIDHPDSYDLAILSGTANQSPAMLFGGCLIADIICSAKGPDSDGQKLADIAFGSYCKRIPDARTSYDWLSRDASVVDNYINDELCGFTCKSGLYRDMMHGLKYITDKKNIVKINKSKPVYLMSGAEDPVGDYGKGVEKAYKAFCDAGCKDVMIRLYPGGRHEMLNELNRKDVFGDILAWIVDRI